MICPRCNKEMISKNKDESKNLDTGKRYEREIFHCKADDVWLTLEVPIGN